MGKDKLQDIFITLEEAYTGTTRTVDVPTVTECNSCRGSGAFPGTGVEMCPVCRGLGQVKQVSTRGYSRHVTIQSCMRCYGKGKIMGTPCDVCHGRGKVSSEKKINIKVPPGVHEGTSLRVPGEGHEGVLGGRRGDLYVKIRISTDDRFEREGSDLITVANISFTQAALGGSVEVDTLNGRAKVSIPPGTQTHTFLRLKGKGMPRMEMPGTGDLLVRVIVRTPEKLSIKQKALFEEIAKDGGEAAVAPGSVNGSKKGLFKKFKFFKKD
jgi:molecular chaperone DnaJ